MNKSKLLKKSLAMILAVMMIVAMIPLSASAAVVNNSAVTDLKAILVGPTAASMNTVDVSGTTFKADYKATDAGVFIGVPELYDSEKAVLIKNDKSETSVAGTTGVDIKSDLATSYSKNADGDYEITLKLTSADGTKSASYKVILHAVTANTTSTIDADSVKVTKALGVSVSGTRINVTAPKGYSASTGGWTANSGDLTFNTKDKATASGSKVSAAGSGYKVTGFADGDVVTITSESTGNSTNYIVNVTEEPILTTMTIGGVAAKIDQTKKTITATFPASVLEIPADKDNAPAHSMEVKFDAAQATSVSFDGTGAYAAMTSGKKYCFDDGAATPAFLTGKKIKVICQDVELEYALALSTEQASDNTVTAATIDGETATIGANSITANLQSSATGAVTVLVSVPKTASVVKGVTTYTTGTPALSDDANQQTIAITGLTVEELKKGVTVSVVAQDKTSKQYTIKVTTTGTVDVPKITSFTLKSGNTVVATTQVGADDTTIKLEVPYITTGSELENYTVCYTTNSYTKVQDQTTPTANNLTSGSSDVGDIGITGAAYESGYSATTGVYTATGKVQAVAKNSTATQNPTTKYDVVITSKKMTAGNTMGTLKLTSAKQYRNVASSNTWSKSPDGDKNIKMVVPFSVASKSGPATDLYLSDVSLAGGAVLYTDTANKTTGTIGATFLKANAALNSATPKADGTAFVTLTGGTSGGKAVQTKVTLWAVPEDYARSLKSATLSSITVEQLKNAGATPYVLTIDGAAPNAARQLNTLKIGDKSLTVSQSAYTITGTVPYSATVDDSENNDGTNATFPEFTTSAYATVKDNSSTYTFVTGGDTDGDGEANDPAAANAMLRFERSANNAVTVWAVDGKTAGDKHAITSLIVTAEDGSKQTYTFSNLKYDAPNTGADITSFQLAGANGTISKVSDYEYTINVTVPFGTKLNALKPTFTVSTGATVANAADGSAVKSGSTIMNFASNVKLKVTSESKTRVITYTVKTTVSDEYTDVPKGQWYYGPVMQATAAGIVNGKGNGIFDPMGNVTRKEFAVMTVRMLGIDPATLSYTTSSYTDVTKDTFGGLEAIEYLTVNDVLGGDGTGKFRPNDPITRQEAAKVVAVAKNLTGTPAASEQFKDIAKVASWATTYVNACQAQEIFGGDDKGNFNPTNNITRAETAKIMVNAKNK